MKRLKHLNRPWGDWYEMVSKLPVIESGLGNRSSLCLCDVYIRRHATRQSCRDSWAMTGIVAGQGDSNKVDSQSQGDASDHHACLYKG